MELKECTSKFEKVGFLREENMIVVDQLVFVAGYVCLGS